ncbi:MAG: MFS transporter [Clostridia bacterium]|nr:MFS transporter [Clostridia bacterium]
MEGNQFESKSYKKGRLFIIAEAAVEYFISLCITSTLLTALLNEMNVDPALHGIVGSITSLACISQLFSVFWVKKSYPAKRWICILNLINQLMFLVLYCIPFVNISSGAKLAIFIGVLLSAYLFQHYLTPSRTQWHMSLVEDSRRGVFTAKKEIISLVGGMIFSQTAGILIDYFKAKGDMRNCFIIFASTIAVLALIHFYLMLSIKEPKPELQPKKKSFSEIMTLIFGNKKLRSVLVFDALMAVSSVSITFLSVYAMVNEKNPNTLGFSATFMATIGIIHALFRAAVSIPLGKYADKRSWVSLLRLCLSVMTVGHFCLVFCTPELGVGTTVLYIVFYLCYAFSIAGTNSSLTNLCFDYVEHEDRRYILGVKNSISGIIAFITSLAWGAIVSYIQGQNNTIFGITVYPQQLLSLISAVITLTLVVFVLPTLKKDKK